MQNRRQSCANLSLSQFLVVLRLTRLDFTFVIVKPIPRFLLAKAVRLDPDMPVF